MTRLLPALLLLMGCNRLPNEDVIALTKQCRDAGFEAQPLRQDGVGSIADIQCVPVHQWRVFKVDGHPRWCDDSTMVCNAEGQGPEVKP